MNATHLITGRTTRLALVTLDHIGNGIFNDLDNHGRVVCPIHPDFVKPIDNEALSTVNKDQGSYHGA